MTIRAVVYDLDGTLVDSGLDFPAIRREMALPDGVPILECWPRFRLASGSPTACGFWIVTSARRLSGPR